MTNNKEECCKKCLLALANQGIAGCINPSCQCHTKAQEEWEEEFRLMCQNYGLKMDNGAYTGLVDTVGKLLRTEREKAFDEGGKTKGGTGRFMYERGLKEGKQQAYAEVKVMVEGMFIKNINPNKETDKYAAEVSKMAVNTILKYLLTKIEEKKEGI